MIEAPRVHLVGAGPGPVDLLTLRAARLLAAADLVMHDQLVTADVLELAGPQARRVAVGRRQGRVVVSHDEVVDRMAEAAHAGARVVRLKGGDPVVFGRGGEEALDLAARGVAAEFVPGISSAVAAGELAGIPVTHRGLAAGFLVLTGQRAQGPQPCPDDLAVAGAFTGTVVLLMASSRLRSWCRGLVEHGRAPHTPAALVVDAGRRAQRVTIGTLADLPSRLGERRGQSTPATLIVGEVVAVPHAVRSALAEMRRLPDVI